MTPSEALKLFDETTAADDFVANRITHAEIVALIRRLHELIPQEKKIDKHKQPQRKK